MTFHGFWGALPYPGPFCSSFTCLSTSTLPRQLLGATFYTYPKELIRVLCTHDLHVPGQSGPSPNPDAKVRPFFLNP